MMAYISNDAYGRLSIRVDELKRIVRNKTRDYDEAMDVLQHLVEGRQLVLATNGKIVASQSNPFVERVELQLAAWRNLGVVVDEETRERILQQATVFEPVTGSDGPLVSGGFGYNNPAAVVNRLIGAFVAPDTYTKSNYLEAVEIRYTPGFKPKGGLRLVHYDPNAYSGLSPEVARKRAKADGVRVAGIEVFEQLALEPLSGLTWDGKSNFYPNASGLDRKYNGAWAGVPYVDRWDDDRKFGFDSLSADDALGGWASPAVREC